MDTPEQILEALFKPGLEGYESKMKALRGGIYAAVCTALCLGVVSPSVELKKSDKKVDDLLAMNEALRDEAQAKFATVQNNFTPCTREQDENLKIAQGWVASHIEEITDMALRSCDRFPQCPLNSDQDKASFEQDFLADVKTTNFFCPENSGLQSEDGIGPRILGSTNADQDKTRVPQVRLMPEIFKKAQADPCQLLGVAVHEWAHTAFNSEHDKNTEAVDWTYNLAAQAYQSCKDNPPEEWIGGNLAGPTSH